MRASIAATTWQKSPSSAARARAARHGCGVTAKAPRHVVTTCGSREGRVSSHNVYCWRSGALRSYSNASFPSSSQAGPRTAGTCSSEPTFDATRRAQTAGPGDDSFRNSSRAARHAPGSLWNSAEAVSASVGPTAPSPNVPPLPAALLVVTAAVASAASRLREPSGLNLH